MSKYEFKKIELLKRGSKISGYLIAVPHTKGNTSGFVVYFTDKLEEFNPWHAKPLIGAFLYGTPELAFSAGEIVLKETVD